MRIVICSGGTGGHMFPACALFEAARGKGHDVTMITDRRGDIFCQDIDKKIVLDTIRFSRRKILPILLHFMSVFYKFCTLWIKKRPDVIIGFGGILTIAPILVAKVLGSKVVIYEQNSIIGKANKFLAKFARLKLSSFKIGESWVEISAPVRKEFLRSAPYKCTKNITILIIGGSQGAISFSNIVPNALSLISEKERSCIKITQQVSHGNSNELASVYDKLGVKASLKKFVTDVAEAMSDSQLVICRSGASTLSELSAIGRPAILIPYPKASENHQFFNAMYYRNKKAAWVLEEKDDVINQLAKILQKILQNRELLKSAASNMINSSVNRAVDDFIRLIESI